MSKETIFIGTIDNYEIVPGADVRGFVIYLSSSIKIGKVAEWVGREVKVTFEEVNHEKDNKG